VHARLRKVAATLAAAALLVGAWSAASVAPARAEPAAIEQARAELERLHDESGALEEQWAQARLRAQAARTRVDGLNADIAAQQVRVDALADRARAAALAEFQSRGVDQATALFVSGAPERFLRGLSAVQKAQDNMNALTQDLQAQQANLADLRRSADAELAALVEDEASMARLDAQARDRVSSATRTLNRLTEAQRAAVASAEDGGVVGDAAAATAAAATGGTAAPRARKAGAYARSKVGKPQDGWGAAGPGSFDCSGLTLAAYAAGGVSLPHSSAAQATLGRSVSRSELRPGDLLFWYSPVSHVGIYVGNGNFVHARNPSVDIVLQSVASYPAPFTGARRVVG